MTLLRLENISKEYRLGTQTIHALDHINLTVHKEEYLSIMGPSGCGKSTLMNILGFLDQPSTGEYFYQDTPVGSLSDNEASQMRNEKIGIVFQTFNLLPNYNILKNVELPLIYSKKKENKKESTEDIALEALNKVGLKDRWRAMPNELSGGQRQRVAIARAIVNSPSLLFADEPTGNLDSKTGASIMKIFEELCSHGTTLFLITHDKILGQRASRQVHMLDGKIIEDAHGRP